MKLHSHLKMTDAPEFWLRAKSRPLDFDVNAEGAFKVATGPISAQVDVIPVSVVVPFLRRNGGVVAAGLIGPFRVKIDPVQAGLEGLRVRVSGALGKEGLECELDGRIGCEMDVDVVTDLPLKLVMDEPKQESLE